MKSLGNMPSIEYDSKGVPYLIRPLDCPKRYGFWRKTAKEILIELNAPQEMIERYDWELGPGGIEKPPYPQEPDDFGDYMKKAKW